MSWYLTDVARFSAERQAIECLAQEVDWFAVKTWRLDDRLRLVLDAEIGAGGRVYPIYLQYPDMFPHTPPSVFPRGDTARWSAHQFGAGGELCLEYGPDTWTANNNGRDLIESCYKLLATENPGGDELGDAPSRHVESLGQSLRIRYSRYLLTRPFCALLGRLPLRVPLEVNLVSLYHKESVVHVVDKVLLADGTQWTDPTVPSQLGSEYTERRVPICRWDETDILPSTESVDNFDSGFAAVGNVLEARYGLIVRGSELSVYFLNRTKNSVVDVAVISPLPDATRLDAAHSVLAAKRVAIVGCGSLGSKAATMLARSGVGGFVLVDDDILLPDNLIRNDLDWRDAGVHKVPALARRLQFVNPSVDVLQWRVPLGGQDANESADAMLKKISECDLILDATADPNVLNLLSAVAGFAKKPVVWAEVFGGGFGGLIARYRPGIEPPPPFMRRAIENWFGEKGSMPRRTHRPYEAIDTSIDVPMIADDADVSVIAAHATRFAIDLLIDRAPSLFPNSVYAIGLGADSVFSQPFETYPIDVGAPPPEPEIIELSDQEKATEIATLLELLKDKIGGADSSPQDN
ncbi:ThiF family adenylyltransferase [Bradyrhizobium sp. SBR1B]|uniref:ThiF family adenylyltransferase n=1 Tax=Bradyrhizobium sp. SBR1B TaxID=2663836 RepID=UPI001605A335|nr:ThiF family adenylyltransferase [Bradyrhizobium sp. SBR1B]MBB4376383.1 molybdopterin/thiamine biosynthesis adenylyltransferase [Bradyrhizobium sp. SBR1B]